MVTLSLSMIVKNEEKVIERALSCVKGFCDEIIVVDTGSTDKTIEIAERMGAQVFHFDWIQDFAAARNEALSHCTCDWIMWLDADDVISPASQQRFKVIKETMLCDDWDRIDIPYVSGIVRERLVRRAAKPIWVYPIHEMLTVENPRILPCIDLAIEHHPLPEDQPRKKGRNLSILQKLMDEGTKIPRHIFCYAHELKNAGETEKSIEAFKKYLEFSHEANQGQVYDALMLLCECYRAVNNTEEALNCALRAIKLNALRARAFNQAGIIHFSTIRFQESLPFFTMATQLSKPPVGYSYEFDEDYTWLPHDYLSRLYEHMGNIEKAIEHRLKSLSHYPVKENIIASLHQLVDKL